MRVGVVDLGTNTTRLLVADVEDGHVNVVERRTKVTRLGEGVDRTGEFAPAALERTFAAVDEFVAIFLGVREQILRHFALDNILAHVALEAVRFHLQEIDDAFVRANLQRWLS